MDPKDIIKGAGGGQDLIKEEAAHAEGLNAMNPASAERPGTNQRLLRTTEPSLSTHPSDLYCDRWLEQAA